MSYPSMYQSVSEGNSCLFLTKEVLKSSEFYYLERGLYPSIKDIVEAMSILTQGRHNQSESCIIAEVCQRTQKFELWHCN